MDHPRRHQPLILYKHYSPQEYPKYDNFDAIEVSKVSEIPLDYTGVMGVPITFLDKYCPDQFEIVSFRKMRDGSIRAFSTEDEKKDCQEYGIPHEKFITCFPSTMNVPGLMNNPKDTTVHGKSRYARILIRNKQPSICK